MMIEALVKAPANLAEMIETAQKGLELSDTHIAEALGFDHPVVTQLLKQGKMRLPIAKVPQLAEVLEVQPAKLLQLLLRETSPDMLEAIEACYGPMLLSDAEVRLIRSIRQAGNGREPGVVMFDKDAVVAMVVATAGV